MPINPYTSPNTNLGNDYLQWMLGNIGVGATPIGGGPQGWGGGQTQKGGNPGGTGYGRPGGYGVPTTPQRPSYPIPQNRPQTTGGQYTGRGGAIGPPGYAGGGAYGIVKPRWGG